MSFIKHISSVISVSKQLEEEINLLGKKTEVAKSQTLCSIGERCRHLYFVEKGFLRGYYFDEGKEITSWFSEEEEFATSFYSFVTNEPSCEIIQTIEDCELVKIAYSDLQNLYINYPETERIGRIITENYYIKLEERILNIQFKTAKERYQKLSTIKPSLLQRASLGQIATYLGITQETLSRIRAEV